MQRTTILVALFAAFLSVPPSGADSKAPPTSTLSDGELAATDTIAEHRCGGDAPSVTECTTGGHVRAGTGYLLVGFDLDAMGPHYTGEAEAIVESAAGDVDFRCRWTNGVWEGCQVVGSIQWPAMGMAFDHRCVSWSNTPLPVVNNQLIAQGIQGGIGSWECLIQVAER